VIIADVRLVCHRRVGVLSCVWIINWRLPRSHHSLFWLVLVWPAIRFELLLHRCLWCCRNMGRLVRIRCGVRLPLEHWHRQRWRLDSVQEITLRVVPWLRGILGVLRLCLRRRLSEVIPETVLFTEIDLANFASDFWCGVPLSPFMLGVWILEWIIDLRNPVSSICDIQRCIVLFQMFRERFGVCGWLRPLRLIRMKLQNILPLDLDTITVRKHIDENGLLPGPVLHDLRAIDLVHFATNVLELDDVFGNQRLAIVHDELVLLQRLNVHCSVVPLLWSMEAASEVVSIIEIFSTLCIERLHGAEIDLHTSRHSASSVESPGAFLLGTLEDSATLRTTVITLQF
jgi:hypothetical protein